jgi:predicted Zn-dependent protease
MSQSRIDVFLEMARAQPDDVMIRYGLANEYFKLENWSEAVAALGHVLRLNPDYTAAYQLLGSAHLNLGDKEAAQRAWTSGIEAASRTGAWKARQHMEGLLAGAKGDSGTEFCD